MRKLTGIVFILTAAVMGLSVAGYGVPKQQPVTKPVTKKSNVLKKTDSYESIRQYFERKEYTGDVKEYRVSDVIAPVKIRAALVTNGLSYLRLLRNEIVARHGYIFKTDEMKRVFSNLKWYQGDKNFTYASLNKTELRNLDFIKRLERIDARGGKDARELSLILDLPKDKLNTDEAIKVYKVTGDKDVLTTIKPKMVRLYHEGLSINRDIAKKFKKDDFSDAFQREWNKSKYLNAKFIIAFEAGKRLLLETDDKKFFIECLLKKTNIGWAQLGEPDGGVDGVIADMGIGNIREDGSVKFKKVDPYYDQVDVDISPFRFYMDFVYYEDQPILFAIIDNYTRVCPFKYRTWKNSLYVIASFNLDAETCRDLFYYKKVKDIEKYAREHGFYSGMKLFRIRILN